MTEAILRAAAQLLGGPLTGPADLGGSTRSTVLRCRTADGGGVIVKAYAENSGRSFAAEATGLALGVGGPRLLGADHAVPLLVIEDLGAAPTLADVLLAGDPVAARHGMLDWAAAVGRQAARSAGRHADFRREWARYAKGAVPYGDEPWIAGSAGRFLDLLAAEGIEPPAGLDADLRRVTALDGTDTYAAFTPGDTCPDNALLTGDGVRLIDFEGACFQSVFLTAAYCRMPFSTCWCVFAPPAGLGAEMERALRAELVGAWPELADDATWEDGVQRAVAAWTLHGTGLLWARAGRNGRTTTRRTPAPTIRQLLAHRWQEATRLTRLPALAVTAGLVLRRIRTTWHPEPLPPYPAFTQGRPGADVPVR